MNSLKTSFEIYVPESKTIKLKFINIKEIQRKKLGLCKLKFKQTNFIACKNIKLSKLPPVRETIYTNKLIYSPECEKIII